MLACIVGPHLCVCYTRSKYKRVCYIYRSVGKQTKCVWYIQDCGQKYKNVCFIYKSVGQNTRMCVIYTRVWVKIQKCV